MRADKSGTHRVAFEKNKKRILKTATHCGICGQLVDKKLKYPNPMCAVIDHVVPLAKGGHPSLIENLQLAHMSCNRIKSDKLFADNSKAEPKTLGNRNLPQSRDWSQFISVKSEGG
ncbi:TPA: HNH endonuclease [Streptococcus suis]|nr:HNH endonuclease [Streptococcus suis]